MRQLCDSLRRMRNYAALFSSVNGGTFRNLTVKDTINTASDPCPLLILIIEADAARNPMKSQIHSNPHSKAGCFPQ